MRDCMVCIACSLRSWNDVVLVRFILEDAHIAAYCKRFQLNMPVCAFVFRAQKAEASKFL